MYRCAILEMWNRYRRVAIDAQASQVQLTERKRAFYAGVFSVLTELHRITQPPASEEEGVRFLADMMKESFEFYKEHTN